MMTLYSSPTNFTPFREKLLQKKPKKLWVCRVVCLRIQQKPDNNPSKDGVWRRDDIRLTFLKRMAVYLLPEEHLVDQLQVGLEIIVKKYFKNA